MKLNSHDHDRKRPRPRPAQPSSLLLPCQPAHPASVDMTAASGSSAVSRRAAVGWRQHVSLRNAVLVLLAVAGLRTVLRALRGAVFLRVLVRRIPTSSAPASALPSSSALKRARSKQLGRSTKQPRLTVASAAAIFAERAFAKGAGLRAPEIPRAGDPASAPVQLMRDGDWSGGRRAGVLREDGQPRGADAGGAGGGWHARCVPFLHERGRGSTGR